MSAMILSPLPATMVSLTEVRLHARRDHDDTPDPLTPTQAAGVWTVETGTASGRFWPRLTGLDTAGDPVTVDVAPVDLPEDPTLVVSPEDIAVKAGMSLPLTLDDRDRIIESIRDAQSDVEAYLGRPVTPATYVEANRLAYYDGWNLTAAPDEPLVRVVSAVPDLDEHGEISDYFTVTYLAGIDARTDPALRPIRRYVAAHAMNSPEFTTLWQTRTNVKGAVKSLSAEGQSVSFSTPTLGGGGQAGSGAPGALPTLGSLDRWRLAGRRVHQAPSMVQAWPHGSMGGI